MTVTGQVNKLPTVTMNLKLLIVGIGPLSSLCHDLIPYTENLLPISPCSTVGLGLKIVGSLLPFIPCRLENVLVWFITPPMITANAVTQTWYSRLVSIFKILSICSRSCHVQELRRKLCLQFCCCRLSCTFVDVRDLSQRSSEHMRESTVMNA